MDLSSEGTIEFAKLNSIVVVPSKNSLNPYYLGLKILDDIEKRWDNPTEEEQLFGRVLGKSREKTFAVRVLNSDQSFLSNYLKKKLVNELELKYVERTMPHVVNLWGKSVHL